MSIAGSSSDHATPNLRGRRRLFASALLSSGVLTSFCWCLPIDPFGPLVSAFSERPKAVAATAVTDAEPESTTALERCIAALETSEQKLISLDGYTAVFSKREVVGGSMTDRQVMKVKVRHEPFGVYMKWLEGSPGRELLYVDGQHEGDLVLYPGGWKGRMTGPVKLNPHGSLAMSESRHPVTKCGLLGLTRTLLEYRREELELGGGFTCEVSDEVVDGRPHQVFTTQYESPEVQEGYRKAVVYVDRDSEMVTRVQTYGWPAENVDAAELDGTTLLEDYIWTEIDSNRQLAAADFDSGNKDYRLCR